MHLYRMTDAVIVQYGERYFLLPPAWDLLINRDKLFNHLLERIRNGARAINASEAQLRIERESKAPVGQQEIWAAGVTYLRSRDARMDESKDAGGADFYQKIYEAERPELFFKSMPHRVAGPRGKVFIRHDSNWNVPEPELAVFINSLGQIQGYTIGNDMSSRSIEGENPLYLPQAKVYEFSAALGPCLYVPEKPLSPDTVIRLSIRRSGREVFGGTIALNRMKRDLAELAAWLNRELYFPAGCYLMTGTGVVPGNDFTLEVDDEVYISVEPIGTLMNRVAKR